MDFGPIMMKELKLFMTRPCNGCVVSWPPGRFTVTTGSGIWSYAAFLPTGPIFAADISCVVEKGTIGIAIVDKDYQFLSNEELFEVGARTGTVVTEHNQLAKGIIFRNVSEHGASILSVDRVAVT